MPTVTFELPEGALSALRLSPTEFVKEMRVAAALLWYSQGEISQSKAAEIAGIQAQPPVPISEARNRLIALRRPAPQLQYRWLHAPATTFENSRQD